MTESHFIFSKNVYVCQVFLPDIFLGRIKNRKRYDQTNGKLNVEEYFDDNKAKQIYYDPDGCKREVREVIIKFNPTLLLYSVIVEEYTEPIGTWKEWDKNGNLTSEKTYDSVKLVKSRKYDKNGNLAKEEIYDDHGEIIETKEYPVPVPENKSGSQPQ